MMNTNMYIPGTLNIVLLDLLITYCGVRTMFHNLKTTYRRTSSKPPGVGIILSTCVPQGYFRLSIFVWHPIPTHVVQVIMLVLAFPIRLRLRTLVLLFILIIHTNLLKHRSTRCTCWPWARPFRAPTPFCRTRPRRLTRVYCADWRREAWCLTRRLSWPILSSPPRTPTRTSSPTSSWQAATYTSTSANLFGETSKFHTCHESIRFNLSRLSLRVTMYISVS